VHIFPIDSGSLSILRNGEEFKVTNRLKDMGETASWRLMVNAALAGAKAVGYSMKRQPGRGLSNTYEMTKDGKTQVVSVRTTRDRYIAFPPLDGGKKWKTLDSADLVLVSAVDDPAAPQSVDVYLFPAEEVRRRFDSNYAARIENGHTVRENFGMWVMIDQGDDTIISQVGHSLAVDYPAIAHFSIDELEKAVEPSTKALLDESAPEHGEAIATSQSQLNTVADVLTFAREKISELTGMPADVIKLDLKMGV
jgi:hypothetical protein